MKIYQRLLAADEDEAEKVVFDLLKHNSIGEVFDHFLVPVLSLVQQDRSNGAIDGSKADLVFTGFQEIIENIPIDNKSAKGIENHSSNVFCLPARDKADELAGQMLAFLLTQSGITVRTFSSKSLANEMVEQVAQKESSIVVISSMPSSPVTHTRYILKRFENIASNMKIIVGIWSEKTTMNNRKEDFRERVVTNVDYRLESKLTDTAAEIKELVRLGAL